MHTNDTKGQVIYQAFYYGGLLTLTGVFYFTLNAHRNIRSREILDFFLRKRSEKSKLNLYKHAGTFPYNGSVTGWLQRILDRLRPDLQALACILRRLGITNIPRDLFNRARAPSLTSDTSGEVIEILPGVVPLV